MLIKKIPGVSELVSTTLLISKIKAIDSKISDLSGLVKKTDYDAKISEIQLKYFTSPDYNKFMRDMLHAKIKQKELLNKSDIFHLVKKF